MKIGTKLIGCVFVCIIFLMLPVNASNISLNEEKLTTSATVPVDLKVKASGGTWTDSSLSANVGTTVEFQVTVEIERAYFWLGVLVELPETSEGPMFNYKTGSISPKPLFPIEGSWYANNEEVCWMWFDVEPPWSKTMTFKATVSKQGTQTVSVVVGGDYSENGRIYEDEGTDSLTVTSSKTRDKSFFRPNLFHISPIIKNIVENFLQILNFVKENMVMMKLTLN